jgi:hypothetical protein
MLDYLRTAEPLRETVMATMIREAYADDALDEDHLSTTDL